MLELLLITIFFASVLAYVFYSSSSKAPLKLRPTPAQMNHNCDADIVIVGGGVVGATLAHSFGKQGKRVVVVEASMAEPDRIIGELLQPGGFQKLKMLGLEEATQGIDSAHVKGYMVFYNGETVHLPYPDLEGVGENPTGRSFHYGKFVMNLRKIAQKQKTVQFIEGTVNKLVEENGVVKGIEYRKDDKTVSVSAPLTIVCNGSGSAFSKTLTPAKLSVVSHFIALELEGANEHLPMPGHGHVMITANGPVLAYPTSSRTVRVLIDFPKDAQPDISNGDMAKHIKSVVLPQLPESIRPFVLAAVDSGKIKMAYNREMASEPTTRRGAILIGDAFNCRHPLTGGGMTVCFNDCYLLQSMLANADLTNLDEVEQILQSYYVERRKVSSTINILANALYSIFAAKNANNPMVDYMKEAVFQYFKRGGSCSTGPVGLLAGLIPNPNTLIIHFFSVAALYCWGQLFPIPTPASVWKTVKLMRAATNIVGPFIADENLLRYLFPPLIFQRAQ